MKRNGQGNGKTKGRRKRGSKKRKLMRAIRLGLRLRTGKGSLNKFNSEKYHSGTNEATRRALAAARARATKK